MATETRGICPACGRECAVTSRGFIRQHNEPRDPEDRRRWGDYCQGTGELPKRFVEDPARAAAEQRGYERGRRAAAADLRSALVAGATIPSWAGSGGKPTAKDFANWAAGIAEGPLASTPTEAAGVDG